MIVDLPPFASATQLKAAASRKVFPVHPAQIGPKVSLRHNAGAAWPLALSEPEQGENQNHTGGPKLRTATGECR